MKTIYTEIANEIFEQVYDRLQYDEYLNEREDIEVEVEGEAYIIPCNFKGEKTSNLTLPATYDHPDEYDDRLWLTIEVTGDVSYEDENGEPQWLPGCNLRAAMVEEGYDYYEE